MKINNEKSIPKKNSIKKSKKIKLQSKTSESINTEEIIKPRVSSSDGFIENVISDKIDTTFNNHYIKTN
jgi:hypothetical protein